MVSLDLAQSPTGVSKTWLKLESMQHTGSFKSRGALNAILAQLNGTTSVCAASGGNHGVAVAWSARLLGLNASIFVPTTCPKVKRRRLESYGARVTVTGSTYEESFERAKQHAAETASPLIHSYDELPTIAGAGTVAAELLEQVPDVTKIFLAVGGGGLLAGTIGALEGTGVTVVCVEPYNARCLGAALRAGSPTNVRPSGIAVDSLGVRRIGSAAFRLARENAISYVEVTDAAIRDAQLALWDELRIGLEPGGATAYAGLTRGYLASNEEDVVGVICCGGNLQPATLEVSD